MAYRPHPSSPEAIARQYESDDAPSRSSMRGDVQITRNPSTDQKNQRRKVRQKTSAGGSRMTPTQADVTRLRMEAARASTLPEQQRLMAEAERADAMIREAQNSERDTDLGAKVANHLLTPMRTHELNTAATDWISTVASQGSEDDPREHMVTQANLWYDRVPVLAKADDGEFAEQARGMARHHAGAFGEHADAAERTFLSRVATLRNRDLDRGTFVRTAAVPEGVAPELNDPGDFPSLGQPGYEGLGGGATSSERADNIQTLQQNNPGTDVTPVNDPGLGQTNDTAGAANGPGNPQQDVGKTGSYHMARGNNEDGTSDDFHGNSNGGHDDAYWNAIADREQPTDEDRENDKLWASKSGSYYLADTRENYEKAKDDARKKDTNNGKRQPSPPNKGPNRDKSKDKSKPDWLEEKLEDETDDNKKESSMQTAPCPACSGRGKVAVRHEGVSGLPQIDQMVDNHDNGPEQTEYPTGVAFPLVGWNPQNVQNAISETEQQLAQRDKLKGASRHAALTALAALRGIQAQQRASEKAARRNSPWAFLAGQDDSGWIGDMGAGGVAPGQQDGGNPGGPNNIEVPDPVYGYGGDTQQPGQNKPFGADEANDRTNQPGSWQVGQPAQNDRGTVNPAGMTNDAGAPGFPNPPKNASARQAFLDSDPEMARARRYAQQRLAAFEAGQLPEYQG